MPWYVDVWQRYFSCRGRARRREYWLHMLFSSILNTIVAIILIASFAFSQGIPIVTLTLSLAYSVLSLWSSIAMSIRRLHDTGRSGWFCLFHLVPIGQLALFVVHLQDSEFGDNAYGANPKGNYMAYNESYQPEYR